MKFETFLRIIEGVRFAMTYDFLCTRIIDAIYMSFCYRCDIYSSACAPAFFCDEIGHLVKYYKAFDKDLLISGQATPVAL